MKEFLKRNTVGSVTSAPYHPSTNGLAERYVQTLKRNLNKMSTGSLQIKLSRLLFAYHKTPQSTTGQTPAELLTNRRPHTHLQCLLPNTAETVVSKQEKKRQDTKAQQRYFSENDDVYVENYCPGPKWLPATVVEPTGPVSYHCKLQDGEIVRKHVNQVRSRHVPYKQTERDPFPEILDTQENQEE